MKQGITSSLIDKALLEQICQLLSTLGQHDFKYQAVHKIMI
jgi:hypothetical protein